MDQDHFPVILDWISRISVITSSLFDEKISFAKIIFEYSMKFFGECCWILNKMLSCYNLSKACETSRKTVEQYLPISKTKIILSVILRICSAVVCLL